MPDLTQAMLDKLLRRLDPDHQRAGEKYNAIQLKLINLFRWRGCPFPEEYAMEVINRIARRIDEGEEIGDFDKYMNVVTRYVLLEAQRQQVRDEKARDGLTWDATPDQDPAELEQQDECFKRCLQTVPATERTLVEQYFQGEKSSKIENRKHMAEQWAISPNALRIRCLRIRERLKACYYNCIDRRPVG